MARERSVSDVCEVLALGWSFRGELLASGSEPTQSFNWHDFSVYKYIF